MKKWQIENSETSEVSKISEILFRVFLFPRFRYSQNRKLGFKNLGKKFPSFPRFPSFPSFPSFRTGHLDPPPFFF